MSGTMSDDLKLPPQLATALAAVADALALLTEEEWQVLGKEEVFLETTYAQFIEANGAPDSPLPERTLGSYALWLFARKYPHLAMDAPVAGTA
jgi:hypothetical protein